MELDEFLGTPETVTTVETPPPVEADLAPVTTTEPTERPRDEQGRFVKEESPEKSPHQVPVSVVVEERRRRQEAEARLAALQNPTPEVKDEDYWNAPVQSTSTIVDQRVQPLQAQIRDIKYGLAEDFTRTIHPDYDQVRETFFEKAAQGDPWALTVGQQMEHQQNPAKFMYDQVKRLKAADEISDLPAFEARIRAEERARVLKEVSGRTPPVPNVPRSLNAEPSETQPTTPGPFEQTPLSSIVKLNY